MAAPKIVIVPRGGIAYSFARQLHFELLNPQEIAGSGR
jgi:hypothetical protein